VLLSVPRRVSPAPFIRLLAHIAYLKIAWGLHGYRLQQLSDSPVSSPWHGLVAVVEGAVLLLKQPDTASLMSRHSLPEADFESAVFAAPFVVGSAVVADSLQTLASASAAVGRSVVASSLQISTDGFAAVERFAVANWPQIWTNALVVAAADTLPTFVYASAGLALAVGRQQAVDVQDKKS
jgi:hypothetical protein